MHIRYGDGETEYGPGVLVELAGDEIATAIDAWLTAHNITINGPRTIRVNGDICHNGEVYVDPSGILISNGVCIPGRGP